MQRFRKLVLSFCFGMAVALFLCGTSQAQQNGDITGTVTDSTGAAIPGATVTVINDDTHAAQTTVSNGSGIYNVPSLSFGHYTVEIRAKGFQTYRKTDVMLDTGMTLKEDAPLTVGASNQTVNVRAHPFQVQSESNEVSTLISGQQVRQIATNGRNITTLITLGTGVASNLPDFNGVTAQGSDASISFNGTHYDHNDYLIDGGEVYDRGSGGRLDVLPSPNSIAQMQVLASNYAPDYGISSGGTMLVSLKSGTRQLHGQAWEFDRNDDFDAWNYLSKQSHIPTPELRLNIFGFNLGGPVLIPHVYNTDRNKTFFFVNEEWRRFIQGVSPVVTETVPTSDFPSSSALTNGVTYTPFNGGTAPIVPNVPGNTAYTNLETSAGLTPGQPFPGSATAGYTIPGTLLAPNALLFMNSGAIPLPNDGTDEEVASPKEPTYVWEDVVRIDHYFSPKYHLMGSWIRDAMSQTVIPSLWSGDSYNTVGSVFKNPSWAAAVRLTQIISPTVVNETGLYVNGNTINIAPMGIYAQPTGWDQSANFFTGQNGDNRMPSAQFSNGPLNSDWTTNYIPWKNAYLDYQIRDDITWTKGRHAFKFGGQYMREDKNQQIQADTQGDFDFSGSQYSQSSYVNFLLGLANTYTQLENDTTFHWLSNTFGGYAMDNWQLTSRLTLQLGLRYDALPHTYEKNNQVASFQPGAYLAANAQTPSLTTGDLNAAGLGFQTVNGAAFYMNGIEEAGQNGFPRGTVDNDYFTWEPRLGFAWDFLGNGKWVLRGGVGVFYERIQGNDIYDTDTTPPFSYQPAANEVFYTNPETSITTGATSGVGQTPAPASLTAMSMRYPEPATAQYSLGLQHQLAPAILAGAEYVGSSAWDQYYENEINDLPLTASAAMREEIATSCSGTGATAPGATACPNINPNANLYRPYLGYGSIEQERTGTNASYNSLQLWLRTASWHGLSAQIAYTWSHEIDIESGDVGDGGQAGASGNGSLSDPYDIKYDRGSGFLDKRNILNINWVYNLPYAQGTGLKHEILGGWQFAGVEVSESGSPQDIYYNGPDSIGLGGATDPRPNIVAPVKYPKTQKAWFTTSSFAEDPPVWEPGSTNNGFGNASKDTIVAPGLYNWNMSLYKMIPIKGTMQVQLRVESYNTFNHTQFNGIDTGTTDPTFGQVTSVYDPRVLQFGGQFQF